TDREYDAPWTVNCAIDDEWWTAEVAIPYETINAFKPEPGHRWKMNVVCTSGQWSPSGSFHEATKYGLVKFVASEKPGVRIGVINRDNGTLQVPWQLAGGGALTVRATAYPPKGIVPLASERAEASPEQSAGQLMLDLGDQTSGLLEVTAFEEPGEILYRRFISFNKSYLGAVPFLKDQPEEVRKPKKPVVKKDATAAERKAAEAADWRPTIDEIEDAIVEQQKWLGNDIGKAPAVPEPWTPMEIRKDVITCWAKEFDLRRTAGLPRQVRCLDEPIFASAPTLEIDGKSLGGRRPTLLVKRKAGDRIETVGAVELEDFNLTIEARYEFDGFTRYDVTLTPMKAGVTVDGLRLVFPFAKERALYYHVWGGNAYGRPTRETANFVGDEPLVTGFESNVWLGDNERGFCWFAEAPKGWSHPDDKDLIHIVPSRRTVDVTVDMLREGTPLNEPVTITFGTMATPAKPRPDEWRTWEGRPTQDWGWYTVFSFPYPPKNPERFSAANKNPWRLPMLSNFFAGRVYMENGHPVPEQWLWGHLWHTSWSAPRPPAGKAAGTAGNIVSYTAQNMASSWPDFYLYKLKSMREKYNLRSVYLDTCIRQVNNPFSGYTWTAPDGSTRGSVDIFAFRDFQKRIYNFIHQDPEGKVMMHHSNQVAIPILSFADMHMNGEHFNTGPHQVQGRHYSDDEVMPPGAARACFTLKQWGVVPTFLPEHPVSTRSAMGYLWVHDMLIYPAWLPNYDTLHKGRDVRKSFGLGDVTFLGYWGDTPPTKPTPGDIYVSAWKKNDGSAVMLLVANMTYDDTLIPLELNEKNLGIPRGKNEIDTLDLEFGGTFKIRKGTLTVPVKEHDFRLLRIETAE
ncbi:MAG: DUF6067 family protein, partial [Candidatus Pacebacteria bacterium]|nr:DUF6067 family protein [Candidatus Paceibacterota bacterium]